MSLQSVHITDQTSGVQHVHIASISPEAAADITEASGGVVALNGVTGLWLGTQAEYDAVSPKVDTVVYVVKG
ncbi:hypothetical protein SEA_FEDE_45 [Microbacterium phage Fede]|nr:hypothetical protein SEA_FEDE_45 [Microbacterium phage Fede]